jgi:hypothetical protein
VALYGDSASSAMTEFELITLLVERRSESIALIQWWASVSFAIVAGAQIYQSHLTLRLVLLIESFYLCFTIASSRLIYSLDQQFEAAFVDLEKIVQPSEQTLIMISQNSAGSVLVNQVLITSVSVAVVLVTCAYPVWLLKANKDAT